MWQTRRGDVVSPMCCYNCLITTRIRFQINNLYICISSIYSGRGRNTWDQTTHWSSGRGRQVTSTRLRPFPCVGVGGWAGHISTDEITPCCFNDGTSFVRLPRSVAFLSFNNVTTRFWNLFFTMLNCIMSLGFSANQKRSNSWSK